jgi:hypothetical protein
MALPVAFSVLGIAGGSIALLIVSAIMSDSIFTLVRSPPHLPLPCLSLFSILSWHGMWHTVCVYIVSKLCPPPAPHHRRVSVLRRQTTYGDLVGAYLGRWGAALVRVSLILTCLGFLISYTIIYGDLLVGVSTPFHTHTLTQTPIPHIHTQSHTYSHTHTLASHTHTHTRAHTHSHHTHTHSTNHTYIITYIYTYNQFNLHTYTHTYTHTHTHSLTLTHTHTNTHTRTRSHVYIHACAHTHTACDLFFAVCQ